MVDIGFINNFKPSENQLATNKIFFALHRVAVHPQNVRFQNVQNVRFTKRQVCKTSGLQNVRFAKRQVYKTSELQNVLLQNVLFQNFMRSICFWHNIHINSITCVSGKSTGSVTAMVAKRSQRQSNDWVFADFHPCLFLEDIFPFSLILSF